jgi:hypothetical protein
MNKQMISFAILAVCLFLLGWWFFLGTVQRRTAINTPQVAVPRRIAQPVVSNATTVALSTVITSKMVRYSTVSGVKSVRLFKSTNYPPQTAEEKAMWEWWDAMEKADESWQWKTPIDFYGKVIDQFGQPVVNAEVELNWTTVVGPIPDPKKSIFTGPDGKFEITGIQGKVLLVDILKEGYNRTDNSQGNFEYAAFYQDDFHVPDPNNPVLFHLRKILDAEPMYLFKTHNDLSPGSPPLTLDVASGKVKMPGDFAFLVQIGEKSNENWFDYSVSVEALNGAGFIVTTEENPNRAPDNGYQKTFAIQQKTTDTNYSPNLSFRFYAKTREGKYGVVYVDMTVPRRGLINFYTAVRYNPSGSKNLEFDYRKQINP